MIFTSFSYICVFVCFCVAAVEENISVVNRVVPEINAGITERRVDDVAVSLPKMFKRKFGGSSYSLAAQRCILRAHNVYRRYVNPSAANMNKLNWSPSLAQQAQDWSDGCQFEHPNLDQHPDYKGIGQNLYFTTANLRISDTRPVDVWYNEEEDYDYATNSCNGVCGNYTQVVWAATTEVGCGITFCPTAGGFGSTYSDIWFVTCNYIPAGNYVGKRPYVNGDVCSECTGDPCKYGLCTPQEL